MGTMKVEFISKTVGNFETLAKVARHTVRVQSAWLGYF